MAQAIAFVLNGARIEETQAPPHQTVLDYLRDVRRLTGTKEGCAEGDCGACTILAGRRDAEGTFRLRAANSCLMLVPQLDGLTVVTIDGLSQPGSELHPIQQAMVETDGTQCGFCTPGFVMAIEGLRLSGDGAADETIHEALAGNLCRCTGYRPIVEAARRTVAGAEAVEDRLLEDARGWAESLNSEGCERYQASGGRFLAPRSAEGVVAALAEDPQARIIAGGTDLTLQIVKSLAPAGTLISLAKVPELQELLVTPDSIRIGAAVSYSDALPVIENDFPAFGSLIRRIGSRQIRALGTIAGNLGTASPIGDTLPCLMALGASVELLGPAGRRSLSVEDFITGYRRTALLPGDFITLVSIPRPAPGSRFFAYKLSKRFDQDISTVLLAARQEAGGAFGAIHLGAMADRPKRAAALQRLLAEDPAPPDAAIDAAIASDFKPLSDLRASAAYRLRAARGLVRRLLAEAAGGDAPLHLEAL